MNQPPVHALFDPRKLGQAWPQPATWPGIPYVQGLSGEDIKPVANYLAVKACFESGDDHSPACKLPEAKAAITEGAKKCLKEAFKKAGIPDDDYCFGSKNDPKRKGGRREDCLAAMLTCPAHFKAPPAAAKTPAAKTPAAKSETNWLLWGGVAVVAAFLLLRKK